MNRVSVAVLKTSPETVFEDYSRLMRLASYKDTIKPEFETALNVDLSWHHFTPASSTPPWQLDSVLKTLVEDGFSPDRLFACFGKKNGIATKKGEILNRQLPVIESHGIRDVHLIYDARWIRYEPKAPLRVLSRIFPDGIYLPEQLMGNNIICLPTMKTDVLTIVAGTMHLCFESLLDERSTDAYSLIHEALADALTIEKEVCSGIFAVMDGVFAGEGSCPRCPVPHEKNVILASSDPVALDAVAATMMGFDPLSIPFIRLAHDAGLGIGDLNEIEISGDDISGINFHFRVKQTGMGARMRRMEKTCNGKPPPFYTLLLASLYYDMYWFYSMREKIVKEFKKGEWGKLFESYRKRYDK